MDGQIDALRKTFAKLKKDIEDLKYSARDTTLDEVCDKRGIKTAPRVAVSAATILRGHFAKVYAMQWCKSSNNIVSASQDGKLIVWNGYSGNKLHAIPLRSSWVMTCSYSPSGNLVACGGLDNICSVYNLKQTDSIKRVTRELSAHTGYLSCCRFIDEREIVTSSGDGTCILWDIETGQQLRSFTGHSGDVMTIAVANNNPNLFVSGACDAKAMIWDSRASLPAATLEGHNTDINAVQFFPNDNLFVTGSDDASCKLFDIRALYEMKSYEVSQGSCGITGVDFSSSGKYLFAGLDDFRIMIWDTLLGKSEDSSTITPFTNRVSCVGVSHDGMALCAGSWDTNLKVLAPHS